jgi:hypothetical protein
MRLRILCVTTRGIEVHARSSTCRRQRQTAPQQFLYSTRIGFGLGIEGCGESVGTREKNGERTSALRYWSDDWKSLIREGSGYWKYVPLERGVRFLTRYDYTTRFGPAGAVFDRVVFRPLLGWATAWSFDCLRLSLERGMPARALVARAARRVRSAAWLWRLSGSGMGWCPSCSCPRRASSSC